MLVVNNAHWILSLHSVMLSEQVFSNSFFKSFTRPSHFYFINYQLCDGFRDSRLHREELTRLIWLFYPINELIYTLILLICICMYMAMRFFRVGRRISDFATRNFLFFCIAKFLDFVTNILLCPPKIPPLVVVATPLNCIVKY